MENKKTFGMYIKNKRTEKNLTQKEFADTLYVTESAVSKWERGLSYPDITLITQICAILGISERELLIAGEDTSARMQERLAERYLKLISRFKTAQYIAYGGAILPCFIVDLATGGGLSWFFVVLASIATAASLTLLPLLLVNTKNRGLITLGVFTLSLAALLIVCAIFTGTAGDWLVIALVSVLFGFSVLFLPFVLRGVPLPPPFYNHKTLIYMTVNTLLLFVLLFTANAHAGGDWFFSVAVPVAGFWLVLPWGYTAIIRYAKINGFFKAAGCLGLFSTVYYFMRGMMDYILFGEPYKNGFGFNFSDWSNYLIVNANIDAIVFFSAIGLSVLFAVAGVLKQLGRGNEV